MQHLRGVVNASKKAELPSQPIQGENAGKDQRQNQGKAVHPVSLSQLSPADTDRTRLLETHRNQVGEHVHNHEDGDGYTVRRHGISPKITAHHDTVNYAAQAVGQFGVDEHQQGVQILFPA